MSDSSTEDRSIQLQEDLSSQDESLLLKRQVEALQQQLQSCEQAFQQERDALQTANEKLQSTVEQLQQRAESERELYEELMRMQDSQIAELSTPLLPVAERVLVMPIIGSIDQARTDRILETLLIGVTEQRARTVILDVSGIHRLHSLNASVLVRASQAVRLLGAELVITGIGASHARSLQELGIDLGTLVTRRELRAGIEYARRRGA
jgi:anti-anti-sigma regulatory factor